MRVHLSVYVLQHVYQRLGTRMSSRQPRWKRKSGYHSLCLCSGVTLWLDHSCDTRQRSSVPFALRLLFSLLFCHVPMRLHVVNLSFSGYTLIARKWIGVNG
jgi:hypothetical protein